MWSRKRWNSEGMCFSSIRCSYFSFIMPTCSWKNKQTNKNISEPRISSIASHLETLIIPGTQTLPRSSTVPTHFCLLSEAQGGWALQAEVKGESWVRSFLHRWPTSFQGFYSSAQSISKTTWTLSFILFNLLISNPVWLFGTVRHYPPVLLKALFVKRTAQSFHLCCLLCKNKVKTTCSNMINNVHKKMSNYSK